MNILKDVLRELFAMFLGDAHMTAAILAVVLAAAAITGATGLPHLLGGLFLLVGCIAVLVAGVRREARIRRSRASRAMKGA